MCDPTGGFITAGLMVMSAHQQQQAAMAQAQATNDAFEKNQALQNEAYTKDMEAFWDEEVAIQKQAYQNAEDAADAKIDMLIERQQMEASLSIANAEGVGGQSSSRAFNVLRRQMANRSFDLDQQFQRGVTALKGERKALQRDKLQRRYSAMGQINSLQRDPGLSTTDRILGLAGAGMKGYSIGSQYGADPAKTPTTTSRTFSKKLNVGKSGSRLYTQGGRQRVVGGL